MQGWLVDRFGSRILLQVGAVLYGIGFMPFSQVETVLTFHLTFALVAIGSSLGGFATVMVAVVSWFSTHRSKAIALSQIGFSNGGLCVPLVVFALESYGWRATAFASGVMVIVIGLPLAQVFRHRPGPHGEVVDGITPHASTEPLRPNPNVPKRRALSAAEAMRTRAFWLISLGHAAALLTVPTLMVHLISYITEGQLGFSLAAAGGIVAFMTAMQVVG